MKIAFFGSSLLSSFRNSPAEYFRGILRNLHSLGHRTTFYEFDEPRRRLHRDMAGSVEWAQVVLYDDAPGSIERAIENTRDADVIIKATTTGPFDETIERAIITQRRANQALVLWDVNAPATLGRLDRDPNDSLRATLRSFDLVFTNSGGDPVVWRYKAFGARECIVIYNGVDPATHHPVAPREEFRGDLGFMANRRPDVEERFDEFFARPAELISGARFIVAGDGWSDKKLPPSIRAAGHVRSADHNAFNCTPRAVLCIGGEAAAANGWSPSARIFEAGGAAACMISDPWEGIEFLLDPGHEILIAQNGDEVAEILRSLEPQTARAIGKAALRRLLAQHTFTHRATQIDDILTGRAMPVGPMANVLSSADDRTDRP